MVGTDERCDNITHGIGHRHRLDNAMTRNQALPFCRVSRDDADLIGRVAFYP
jgi:hypothetical protein